VKAAMLGPVCVKIGPDTNGDYHYIGGDERTWAAICDSRFAELVCYAYNRLERTTKNAKTGHRFVTAEDQFVLNHGKDSVSAVEMKYSRDAHFLPMQPVTMAEVREHFPGEFRRYSMALGKATVDEIEAHPQRGGGTYIWLSRQMHMELSLVSSSCSPRTRVQGSSTRSFEKEQCKG
jgi:hypothetical protein